MATIGQALTSPESGWKRYDLSPSGRLHSSIASEGTWNVNSVSGTYGGSAAFSNNGKITLIFSGTRFRLIANRQWNCYNGIIKIDGEEATFHCNTNPAIMQCLVYEKTGLENQLHTVVIETYDSQSINVDAIDIDDTGRLLHPQEKLDIQDIQNIGDRIKWRYTANTSSFGVFHDLGVDKAFISPTGTYTPDGTFYLIYVETDHLGRKILIADRNVQTTISWDLLNSEGVASGSGLPIPFCLNENLIPIMTSDRTPIGIAELPEFYSKQYAYYAFDESDVTYTMKLKPPFQLSYDFGVGNEKVIGGYAITPRYGSYLAHSDAPKQWTFEGWDGEKWIVLDRRDSPPVRSRTTFSFFNKKKYQKYRINASMPWATNGNTNIGLVRLEMFEPVSTHTFTLRLLTGGVASSDKDNEWDRFIVKSNLNGTIVPGDNVVWNWSDVYSWSSTTNGTHRVYRGKAAVTTWGANPSASSNYAFRPVLLVEELTDPNHYLFQDNERLLSFSDSAQMWQREDASIPIPSLFTMTENDLGIVVTPLTKLSFPVKEQETLEAGKIYKASVKRRNIIVRKGGLK